MHNVLINTSSFSPDMSWLGFLSCLNCPGYRCVWLEAALHRPIGVCHQSTTRAIESRCSACCRIALAVLCCHTYIYTHTYTYVDASLATVSIGRYTQAIRHIVMINLTSCTIVINEYSKMPQSSTAIGLRTHSMVNDVKLTVPRWRTRLHAWCSRMGHLYISHTDRCAQTLQAKHTFCLCFLLFHTC